MIEGRGKVMDRNKQLDAIRSYAHQLFHNDHTGHDYYHMKRVAHMARQLAIDEEGDLFICEAAGWLHDVGDRKLFNDPLRVLENMNDFLNSIGLNEDSKREINHVISTISFSGGKTPTTLAGKIVQDADRLDAIGAIGIARTFHYGGANNQLIYKPDDPNTSIQHFYDKLLKLKEGIHTASARKIAEERHNWLLEFLDQFHKEWI